MDLLAERSLSACVWQACCDACDRTPDCVKFVYEKFGGGCTLYQAFAERYNTPAMIAGLLLRHSPIRLAQMDEDDLIHAANVTKVPTPPTPPMLWFEEGSNLPPPLPPPGDDANKQGVLEYASIFITVVMVGTFSTFAYCFFYSDLLHLLFIVTSGVLGKQRSKVMPKALQMIYDADAAAAAPKESKPKKFKALLSTKHADGPGQIKVTIEAETMTQGKVVDASVCANFDELKKSIWDECGHLLKGASFKDAVILCRPPSQRAWMKLSGSSDVEQAISRAVFKLTESRLLDPNEKLEMAFVRGLKPPEAQSGSDNSDASDSDEEGTRLLVEDGSEVSINSSRSSRNRSRSGSQNGSLVSSRSASQASSRSVSKVSSCPTSQVSSVASGAFTSGQRVQLSGLASMSHLNGAIGVVKGFDGAKQRYRVKLDATRSSPAQTLAFRGSNLTPARH